MLTAVELEWIEKCVKASQANPELLGCMTLGHDILLDLVEMARRAEAAEARIAELTAQNGRLKKMEFKASAERNMLQEGFDEQVARIGELTAERDEAQSLLAAERIRAGAAEQRAKALNECLDAALDVVLDLGGEVRLPEIEEARMRRAEADAFRLMVDLASAHPGASFAVSISRMHDGRGFADAGFFSRDNPTSQAVDADLGTATRLAIGRAAAAIAAAKKEQGDA